MNNYYMPSSVLKKYAREQICDKLGTVIGAFLVHTMCVMSISYLIASLIPDNLIGTIVYIIFTIFLELFVSVFMYGEYLLYLKAASGGTSLISDIFTGFKDGQLLKIVLVRLIPSVVSKLAFVPYYLAMMGFSRELTSFSNEELMKIIASNDIEAMDAFALRMMPIYETIILASLIYLLGTFVVEIIFSQVLFIIHDYPELTFKEVLKRNFAIMKGNYLRYALVWLSFIPWYILAMFTCGLTLLWTKPYMWAVRTNFYLDLARKNKDFGGM